MSGKESQSKLKRPPLLGSSKKRKGLDKESVDTLLQHLIRAMEYEEEELEALPKEEKKETESWLDWGINLVKEYGSTILSAAPALLALL